MPVARTACDRSRETTTSVPSRPPSFREPSFIGTPDRILEIVSIVTFAGTRCRADPVLEFPPACVGGVAPTYGNRLRRSEEHTSELQSLMRISYAVICLKKKN